jgi:hypothetical protein
MDSIHLEVWRFLTTVRHGVSMCSIGLCSSSKDYKVTAFRKFDSTSVLFHLMTEVETNYLNVVIV